MRFEETIGISHVLRLVDHAMKRRLDQVLTRWRLTAAQYMALSALEAKGPLTNADLSRECSVTPQTTNRLIESLVDAGLIKRTDDPAHGRKLTLSLTKRAVALICEAHVGVNDAELAALGGLSPAQIKSLGATLTRVLANLGSTDAGPG